MEDWKNIWAFLLYLIFRDSEMPKSEVIEGALQDL